MLTKRDIDFYNENGFITVDKVILDNEIFDLKKITDEFVEKSRYVNTSDDIFDLEPGHTNKNPKLRRIKEPIKHHKLYKKTFLNKKILDIVSQLLGPSIRSNGNKLNMKSGKFGSPVKWHQDWAFYPHTNDKILAVGVCLDDMNEENGCLQVIPGSHKGPIFNHHYENYFAGAITDDNFDASKAVKIELKAGDISIHHVRTIHGSLTNSSLKQRRLLLFQYCSGDSWPLTNMGWEDYKNSFVRGNPSNKPLIEHIPVLLPFPEAKIPGSIYANQSILKKP